MKAFALLLSMLLCLLAARCWMDGSVEAPPDRYGMDSHAASSATASHPGVAMEAAVQTDDKSAEGPHDNPVPALRSAIAAHQALLPLPEPTDWTDLLIVDRETGEPVAGATVAWADNSVKAAIQQQRVQLEDNITLWQDREVLAMDFGWQTTSNGQGQARVHRSAGSYAIARHGTRYGWIDLDANLLPPRQGFRLMIAAELQVKVQVLDAYGQPAIGVPLTLSNRDGNSRVQTPFGSGAATQSNAPDGLAVIRHLQPEQIAGSKEWRVHALLPHLDDPGVLCNFSTEDADPITLQLPPCGVVIAKSALFAHGAGNDSVVTLREPDQPSTRSANFSVISQRRIKAKVDAEGCARFPHVPLGKKLTAFTSQGSLTARIEFPGPTQQGEVVRVELNLASSAVLLRGRVQDEHGNALANVPLTVAVRAAWLHGEAMATTDSAGGFLVQVGYTNQAAKPIDSIVIRHDPADQPQLEATISGRPAGAGIAELGDLILRPRPAMLMGQIQVDGSTPAHKLGMSVQQWREPQGDRPGRWQPIRWSYTQADDGRFSFFGEPVTMRCRLLFTGDRNHLPMAPIEFSPGTRNLLVQLRSGHRLSATAILPESEPKGRHGGVDAILIPIGEAARPTTQSSSRLSAEMHRRSDGRLQANWPALDAGNYRLQIKLRNLAEAVYTLDNVQLPQTGHGDPRLVDIDLGQVLRIQTIRVTSAAPRSNNSYVFTPEPQVSELPAGIAVGNADLNLLLPRRPIELLFASAGYQPRRMPATGERIELELLPWPRLVISCDEIPELPEQVRLMVRLDPTEPDTRRWSAEWDGGTYENLLNAPTSWFVISNRLELPIGNGTYLLQLRLSRGAKHSPISFDSPRLLQNVGSLQLRLPKDAIATALQALQDKGD